MYDGGAPVYGSDVAEKQIKAVYDVFSAHFDFLMMDDGFGENLPAVSDMEEAVRQNIIYAIRLSDVESDVQSQMREILFPIAEKYKCAGSMGATSEA